MTWLCLRTEVAVEFQTLAQRRDDLTIATDVAVKLRRLGGFYRAVTKRKRESGELVACALPECSVRFVALRGGKYCSKRCRDRAGRVMQPERRHCEHPLCRNVFVARRNSHRFCSSACVMSAKRMEHGAVAGRAPRPRGPRVLEPYPRLEQFAQRQARLPDIDAFAGYAKQYAVRRAKQLRERPAIVCANPRCQVSFVPKYSHTLYCAEICQIEHRAQKQRAARRRRWQAAAARRR